VFLALDSSLATVEARPNQRAQCPLCRKPVLSKCGEIVDWHWAHLAGGDCDPWAEAETPWHRWWKERAPASWREVTVGEHRADIRRPDDHVVIELQHSPISPEEIREREAYYGHMVWLIDGRLLTREVRMFDDWTRRLGQVRPGTWSWLWPRKSFLAARRRVFLDLGTSVLEVKGFEEVTNLSPGRRRLANGFYLHGEEVSRDAFIERARLRPVAADERPRTVGFIAEWRPPSREPQSVPRLGLYRHRGPPGLRRREFRSEALLRRWAARGPRAELSLLRWMGDGSVVELRNSSADSAQGPAAG